MVCDTFNRFFELLEENKYLKQEIDDLEMQIGDDNES